jgi:very-short-patch-repair endonuclease
MAGQFEARKRDKQARPPTRSHVHPTLPGKHGTANGVGGGSQVHPVVETLVAVCARLGASQEGAVSRRQLLSAGISRHAIDHAIKTGYLHRVHRGVYIVGHLALAPFATESAALLSCGQGAVVSHHSAAYLWGLVTDRPSGVDITAVARNCGSKAGIRVHRVADIDKRELRSRHGLPITSPARTLIDLAAEASLQEMEDGVAEARVKRLIRSGELEAAVERAGRRRGAARMREFLRAEGGPAITRSRAERHFRALLRQARLPAPGLNVRLAGREVDFLWRREQVALELDSWQFHGHRRAFERDRRKDMALADAGYQVIRVTWRQFTEEPLALVAHLARALDRATRPHG